MKSKTHGQKRFTCSWRLKGMRSINQYLTWFVLKDFFKDEKNLFQIGLRKMMRAYTAQSHRFVPEKIRRLSCSTKTFTPYSYHHNQIKRRSHNLTTYDSFMGCDTDKRQYLTIFESDFRVVAGISAIWGEFKVETGGDIFALATHGGRIVILLVTGPGLKAVHKSAFFK